MKEYHFNVTDPNGIHARPAGELVKKMQAHSCAVTFTRGNDSCDGKKLIALMKLRVKSGDTLVIKAEGDDEDAAIADAKQILTEIQ